jgi:hypothetical protein
VSAAKAVMGAATIIVALQSTATIFLKFTILNFLLEILKLF